MGIRRDLERWRPSARGGRTNRASTRDAPVGLEIAQRVVLGALLEAHPGPLSRAELATMLNDAIAAADAIDALLRDGVANRAEELVFASHAAIRTDQLRH